MLRGVDILVESSAQSPLEKKVIDYIKTYKAKGYSLEDIKAGLKKSGVDELTIKKCLKISGIGGGASFMKSPAFLISLGVVVLLIVVVLGAVVLFGGPECESDRDCDSGYECSANICVEEEEEEVECTSDSDCGSGYECSRNSCVYIGEEEEEEEEAEEETDYECDYDADCGDDEVCEDNYCVEDDSSAEAQCGDGDCNEGESCALDCGCAEDSECEVYGEYYCDSDTLTCEYTESSSSGSSSSDDDPRADIDLVSVLLNTVGSSEAVFDITVLNDGEGATGEYELSTTLSYYNTSSGDYVELEELITNMSDMEAGDEVEVEVTHDVSEIYTLLSDGTYEEINVKVVAVADPDDDVSEEDSGNNEEEYEATWILSEMDSGTGVDSGGGCTYDDECDDNYACIDSECATSCEVESDDDSYCADGYTCSSGVCEVESTIDSDAPRCSDNYDNDGDGLVDYPYDRGCFSLYDDDERSECGDGWDNDGDGAIDLDDEQCTSESDLKEIGNVARCNDGWDNDGDGLVDLEDPDCEDEHDDDERDVGEESSGTYELILGPLNIIDFSSIITFAPEQLTPWDKVKAFILGK
jgi:hypothetical protein